MLCGSRKKIYPEEGDWKFQRGGGLKSQNSKGKYEPKLEFPKGWEGGLMPINPSLEGYGHVLEGGGGWAN